jgi:flagellar hook-length control protein FliK
MATAATAEGTPSAAQASVVASPFPQPAPGSAAEPVSARQDAAPQSAPPSASLAAAPGPSAALAAGGAGREQSSAAAPKIAGAEAATGAAPATPIAADTTISAPATTVEAGVPATAPITPDTATAERAGPATAHVLLTTAAPTEAAAGDVPPAREITLPPAGVTVAVATSATPQQSTGTPTSDTPTAAPTRVLSDPVSAATVANTSTEAAVTITAAGQSTAALRPSVPSSKGPTRPETAASAAVSAETAAPSAPATIAATEPKAPAPVIPAAAVTVEADGSDPAGTHAVPAPQVSPAQGQPAQPVPAPLPSMAQQAFLSAGTSSPALPLNEAVGPAAGGDNIDDGLASSSAPSSATTAGDATATTSDASGFRNLLDTAAPRPGDAAGAGRTAAAAGSPVTDQAVVLINRAIAQKSDRMTIQLKPADLGNIEVKLDFSRDGHVHIAVLADRQDTLDLLQRDAKALQQGLQDAGIKSDTTNLSFDLRRDGGGFQPNGGGTARHAYPVANDDVLDLAPIFQPQTMAANGRLDIRV